MEFPCKVVPCFIYGKFLSNFQAVNPNDSPSGKLTVPWCGTGALLSYMAGCPVWRPSGFPKQHHEIRLKTRWSKLLYFQIVFHISSQNCRNKIPWDQQTSSLLWWFQVGERLARYDVEKQCAMDKGDFEEARKKKEQMEEYRKSVYQQLEVHNLLDMAMVCPQLAHWWWPQYISPNVLMSIGWSCHDWICLWRIFLHPTDHRGVVPGPGTFLPPAVSRPPSGPCQAPRVHRNIQEAGKKQDTPRPTARSWSCSTEMQQPAGHTVHICSRTQDRRECRCHGRWRKGLWTRCASVRCCVKKHSLVTRNTNSYFWKNWYFSLLLLIHVWCRWQNAFRDSKWCQVLSSTTTLRGVDDDTHHDLKPSVCGQLIRVKSCPALTVWWWW